MPTSCDFQVTVRNDFSDELFESTWSYLKEIEKRETTTGTTTGHYNYNSKLEEKKYEVSCSQQSTVFNMHLHDSIQGLKFSTCDKKTMDKTSHTQELLFLQLL